MERSCRCQDFVTLRPGIYAIGWVDVMFLVGVCLRANPGFSISPHCFKAQSINRVTFLMTLIIMEDMGAFWDDAQNTFEIKNEDGKNHARLATMPSPHAKKK